MSEEADRLLQPEPFERDQYDKQVEELLPCQHYLACLGDLGIHDAECWAYRRIPVAAALRGLAAEKDKKIERLKANRDYWLTTCQEAQTHRDAANSKLGPAQVEIMAEKDAEIERLKNELLRIVLAELLKA